MRSPPRASVVILLLCTLLVACKKKKERTLDENLAEGFSQMGVTVPAATGASVAVPKDAVLVFILPDKIAIDGTHDFVAEIEADLPVKPSPAVVVPIDPARASTAGISDKYKRTPADPYIVPLGNALSSHTEKGRHQASIVAPGQPPDQVFKEVRATLAASGFNELYRIVRTPDGKLAAEKLTL